MRLAAGKLTVRLITCPTVTDDFNFVSLLTVQPSMGKAGETRLLADVSRLQEGHRWCTVLGEESTAIWGTEHLLAALECCGVHNARIEVEGGKGTLVYLCITKGLQSAYPQRSLRHRL